MKCIDNLKDFKLNNTAITIGKFDGLHKGHNKLFSVLKENSKDYYKTVLTFAAKPIDIINNEVSLTIVTEEEKRLLCEKAGMDYYISLPLNRDFLDLSPEQFVREILVGILDIRLIVCGPDFTFGKFGAGNVKTLKMLGREFGFDVIVVEKEQYHQQDIGSTEIRSKILEGSIEEANEMLGHPYSVIGRVTEGKQLGRKMGLPTANIIPDKSKILPPRGVYRTKLITKGNTYNSISNIGINPTVDEDEVIKLETHIIDDKEYLYNEIVEIQFFEYIRPELKFDSVEALKAQINSDIEKVKKSIATHD